MCRPIVECAGFNKCWPIGGASSPVNDAAADDLYGLKILYAIEIIAIYAGAVCAIARFHLNFGHQA